MKWLNILFMQENAMECGGLNSREAQDDPTHKKPASTYMFGPLTDAKTSHLYTVLT